jgi:hypothetical protein
MSQAQLAKWTRAHPSDAGHDRWLSTCVQTQTAPEATMLRVTKQGTMDLSGMELGNARVGPLASALSASVLTSVNLSKNRLSGDPLSQCLESLVSSKSSHLVSVDLSYNDVSGDSAMRGLATLVAQCRTLSKLTVIKGHLSDREGALLLQAIGNGARAGRGVASLTLAKNRLGIASARTCAVLLEPSIIDASDEGGTLSSCLVALDLS